MNPQEGAEAFDRTYKALLDCRAEVERLQTALHDAELRGARAMQEAAKEAAARELQACENWSRSRAACSSILDAIRGIDPVAVLERAADQESS